MAQYNYKSITLYLLILLMCTFCWQSSLAYGMLKAKTDMSFNPNIRCPGRNEVQIWKPCTNGGYIVNNDPLNCPDRYVCYRGVGELCNDEYKCADNAICTVCNKCRKCESPEKCSGFELCPGIREMNAFKRFMQKGFLEYNDN